MLSNALRTLKRNYRAGIRRHFSFHILLYYLNFLPAPPTMAFPSKERDLYTATEEATLPAVEGFLKEWCPKLIP